MRTSCTRATRLPASADHRVPDRQPEPRRRRSPFHPDQGNGSLATSGSVSFNFERKGQIEVPSEGVDFDDLFEKAGDAGAEDVIDDGDVFTVITDPSDLHTIRKALQDSGFDYDSADMVMRPKNEVSLSLEDAQKVSKLIDNLDDLDDVQNIYANWTASDEVMAQLADEE